MATEKKGCRAVVSAAMLFMAVFVLVLVGPGLAGTAMAARDRIVLEYHDSHLRSDRGGPATLFLKKTLRDQYPWVEVEDLDLRRVVLVAKSRHGRGEAYLRVGHRMTETYPVHGRPNEFRDDRRRSFDRIQFTNPSHDSSGPWQIDLHGNFVVRQVVLEVADRPHRHRLPPRPYRY